MSPYFIANTLSPNINNPPYPINFTPETICTSRNIYLFSLHTYLQHYVSYQNFGYYRTKTLASYYYSSLQLYLTFHHVYISKYTIVT